ncbi:MAG: hypothetical protein EOT05_02645 [Candidatus Microsaccharimonas sossegonensis]|uniref:Uncharacterized protein n=1 Tax=Candidatus Microsaccharimonas sossegonensis TaxID=2506948 RepID=A0A4Q0AHX8_9BACT|nr:MAG: hypothetical protein EOT05_02645 [Candidatus Microsaccharimonas sossegonensis]
MKKIVTLKGLLAFGPVVLFIGLYGAGLVYTGWHSKQGNLWLMILDLIAIPLTWFVYFRVSKHYWGVPRLTRHSLGASPVYVTVIACVLFVLHLFGFMATDPEAQKLWAYLPYAIPAAIGVIYLLMKGAEANRKHQV